ncbi:MAG: CcdB family protein [Sulfitobacter sp.]
MSRFDLYRGAEDHTYLLDLQSEYLEDYSTRVVAPVVPLADFKHPVKGLNPLVTIQGEKFVVLTHFIAAVPVSGLRGHVMNLLDQSDELTRALDLLFQGY